MAGTEATEQLPAEYARSIGPVSVLQVRPDIYMLTVAGVNVAVETGEQGSLVVNTAPAGNCPALVAAIKAIVRGPIRYVANTSGDDDRIGCNAEVAQQGLAFARSQQLGFAAPIIAYNNVVLRLIQEGKSLSPYAFPNEVFTRPVRNMYLNGQAIQSFWMPQAHSDGDTIVMFRHSDLVVAGDIFDETRFPVIDVAHGGSIDGELAALNRLLDEFTVTPNPKFQTAGGTLVIPGRGQLCYEADVLNYRDMISIIRERVKAQLDRGATLEKVEQSNPAADYAPRFGSDSGSWTTHDFIAAVYRSLKAEQSARGNR
jgi:glyoxylase-like metal-dependent hydrolase (beta-lactamase superfamily II)